MGIDRTSTCLQASINHINVKLAHALEFGVYKGRTLRYIRDRIDKSIVVFGFDSFQGLPENWPGTNCSKGKFKCKQPEIAGVVMYAGWFEETIPDYLKIAKPIALLHIDSDLYS